MACSQCLHKPHKISDSRHLHICSFLCLKFFSNDAWHFPPSCWFIRQTNSALRFWHECQKLRNALFKYPYTRFCMPKIRVSANINQILQQKIDVKYHPSINIYLTPPYLSYFSQVHIVCYILYLQFLIIINKNYK